MKKKWVEENRLSPTCRYGCLVLLNGMFCFLAQKKLIVSSPCRWKKKMEKHPKKALAAYVLCRQKWKLPKTSKTYTSHPIEATHTFYSSLPYMVPIAWKIFFLGFGPPRTFFPKYGVHGYVAAQEELDTVKNRCSEKQGFWKTKKDRRALLSKTLFLFTWGPHNMNGRAHFLVFDFLFFSWTFQSCRETVKIGDFFGLFFWVGFAGRWPKRIFCDPFAAKQSWIRRFASALVAHKVTKIVFWRTFGTRSDTVLWPV